MRLWIFMALPCLGSTLPTFNHDIAPIIYKNCSGCHRPGEVAPFSLLTYADAAKRARQIPAITQARQMPPWKAAPGYGHFQNERRLTEFEIATLGEWAKNGSPEGDPGEKPSPPVFAAGWQGGVPDQVVTMLKLFELPAEGADKFRCFVIPLGAAGDEYVKTVEFRPGNPRIVHHAIFFLDNSGLAPHQESVPGIWTESRKWIDPRLDSPSPRLRPPKGWPHWCSGI